MTYMLKRVFDCIFAIVVIFLSMPIFLWIIILIKLTSRGPILYWSERIGKNNQSFKMPKFRTMQINTPALATHLLADPQRYLTSIGAFLRRFSLDELPQVWSILSGHMSVVGPRPALFNQDDLVKLRTLHGVDRIKPGLTGLAQINGRDELPIFEKVQWDLEYVRRCSLWFDFKIIALTFLKVLKHDGVSH